MLEHFFVPQLNVNSVIWKQDVALPHYHGDVMWYLNQMFLGIWVGNGYIPWLSTSSDPAFMDFSFWEIMKDNVYIS
jgi:hypothetical protein